MSELVSIIPNLETRQKAQVVPTIKTLSEDLLKAEKSSFNTVYLQNIKRRLNISLLFNGMINETIGGLEEHTVEPAENLIDALSKQFGIMSSSRSDINTSAIAEIPNPDPPSYEGPASTLISVVEDSYYDMVPQFNLSPDIIVNYNPGTEPNTTVLTAESATYVAWTGDTMKTTATGSQELSAVKLSATTFVVDAAIDTDTILGQTTYLQRGEVSREKPMIVINWETAANFTGYKLYRNGILLTTIVESTTGTYQDKNIERGVTYSYTIAGIDETFGEIAKSTAISIQLDTLHYPTTLTGEFLEEDPSTGTEHVYLQWESMGVAVDEVGSYKIFKDGDFLQIVPGNVISYRDRNIFPATTHVYTVVVRYVNSIESVPSNEVSVDIPAGLPEGIYIPRLDSAVISNGGATLTVNWGSNGNTQDVTHDIYVDRKIYYGVSGSRDVASDTIWTESYTFTPDDWNAPDPHSIMVRAVRGTESSAFSEKKSINVAGPNNDVYIFVEGQWTDDTPDGVQLPLDYTLDIGAEYHGEQTDVTRVAVSINALAMNIEPFSYVQDVSPANNYRFDAPLSVTYYGAPDNGQRISIYAAYYGQFGQVVAERSVLVYITDPPVAQPDGIVTKEPLETDDTMIKLWGTDVESVRLFSEITIDTFTTVVKQEYNYSDYKLTTFNEPYTGNYLAANEPVTVLPPQYDLYVAKDTSSGTVMLVYGKEGLEATFYPGAKIQFKADSSNTEYTISSFYDHKTVNPYDSSYLKYVLIITTEYSGDVLSANSGIIKV